MTEPLDDFIPRELDPPLSDILNQFSTWIDELVNFGSLIVKWYIEEKAIKDEDLPALLFLRNFIEQIDAISILIAKSGVEPCKTLLRTGVENLLYLEYLTEKETYNRSMAFLVWNCVNNNKNLERLDSSSEKYKNIEALYLKDKLMKDAKPASFPLAAHLLSIGEAMLVSPKYMPIKAEYDLTRKKLKNNMSWYSLFDGPRNIKELAEKLNHFVLYDSAFRNYSASTHGVDILQGKLKGETNEDLGLLQIRSPQNAQNIVQFCFNFCFMVYSNFIEKILPEKNNEYKEWRLNIREVHMKLCQTKFIDPK